MSDFNTIMQNMVTRPDPRLAMPPAEGGTRNAGQVYQDAISGRAPQFIGLAETKGAAESWLGQFPEATADPLKPMRDEMRATRERADANARSEAQDKRMQAAGALAVMALKLAGLK